ncbi:hypothetical protein F0562_006639 [Nyssa sinensis]|uniref:Uncharacterized protein n=1 Tax=Nyssa sinensis TaxID=561372 RepID=A0A5J5AMW0_9ASTE|nr:hypothetical protein F0562_006639 [Nyssa sinensis]
MASSRSRMKSNILTQDVRVLPSTSAAKNEITSSKAGDGFESAGLSSSSESPDHAKGQFFVRDQVFTTATGPSRKGTGHK